MKKKLSVFLVLLLIMIFPISAYAKPAGGGGTGVVFAASITILPAVADINVNDTITFTANWSANQGINRTQWYVDGTGQGTATLKPDKMSGTSTFIYKGTTQGSHTVMFRVWNIKYVGKRDASKSVSVTVHSVTPPDDINYVSLGDSIATGTTTPLTSSTDPYTDHFQDYLEQSDATTTVIRSEFETDGYQTGDLLGDLQSDTTVRNAIIASDVVTISIGGNNLMYACKNWLGLYDFYNPDMTKLSTGYANFKAQWGAIMAEIHGLNGNAKVLVMTLYNPYNTYDTTMHQLVDSYYSRIDGSGMNDLINNNDTLYRYHVVNSYSAFDAYSEGNMETVTLLYPDSFLRNPHPTQFGQNLLFGLHKEIYDAIP